MRHRQRSVIIPRVALRNRGVRMLAPLSWLRATLGLQETPRRRGASDDGADAPRVWPAAVAAQHAITNAELENLHEIRERYVREVTWDGMTISHQLCTFLLALCRTIEPRQILDIGSGLSSLVFRRYAASSPGARVWSVDDDGAWLAQTAELLQTHDLPTDNLLSWPERQNSHPDGVDLVFHDLGSIATRIQTLPWVLSRLAPSTPCVLDDTHFRRYWRALQALAGQRGTTVTRLRTTADRYGRFASGLMLGGDDGGSAAP